MDMTEDMIRSLVYEMNGGSYVLEYCINEDEHNGT